ncbi:MAG TPA: sugar phosphate nucleotidyltransferase [Thermomicrobiales bacterium]|nr:sugar phosphate nucleotidyltransferase [Thermomicrobiales bacterium]
MHRDFYTVIPAGGAGTRLWPLSRADRPKFLLPLLDGMSLLQLTAARVASFSPPDRIYTVSGKAHVAAIARQLPDLPESNLIVEPAMRGTGSAIALAAMLIAKRDPHAIMGSFAADHNIRDIDAFRQALTTAISSAEAGYLTTIGIEPDRPETGYGYIERSDELALPGAYFARRFVEKPDSDTAKRFLESGRYLWNASMFVWRVDVFLQAFERAQPALFAALESIAASWDDANAADAVEQAWLDLPITTIDQGLMEHVDEFVVVPADMGWSDIGDWNGFADLIVADIDENCINGQVVAQNTSRCVVWSETGRTVALVGIDNLAVIDLPDALMIVDRTHAQDVRALVARMEQDYPDLT